MYSPETVALLREHPGPLFELEDDRGLGAARYISTAQSASEDGQPERLTQVTMSWGLPAEGAWINVTTVVAQQVQSRPQQHARTYLRHGLWLEQVVAHRSVGKDLPQEYLKFRRRFVDDASPAANQLAVDGRQLVSWRVEAQATDAATDIPVLLRAEAAELPGIEIVVWGRASLWPISLRRISLG